MRFVLDVPQDLVANCSTLIRRTWAAENLNRNPMDITSLIIEAVSGAVGGNVAGAAMKEKSLGTMGNSIAGILGGGIGGTILQAVMGSAAAGGGMDIQSILANVGGGGVGGAILMIVIGLIKQQMSKG